MKDEFPANAQFYELNGVPYCQIFDPQGDAEVFNCAFAKPKKVSSFQRLRHWKLIDRVLFDRLRAAYLAAGEMIQTTAKNRIQRAT